MGCAVGTWYLRACSQAVPGHMKVWTGKGVLSTHKAERSVTYHLFLATLPPWICTPLAAWAFRAQPRRGQQICTRAVDVCELFWLTHSYYCPFNYQLMLFLSMVHVYGYIAHIDFRSFVSSTLGRTCAHSQKNNIERFEVGSSREGVAGPEPMAEVPGWAQHGRVGPGAFQEAAEAQCCHAGGQSLLLELGR